MLWEKSKDGLTEEEKRLVEEYLKEKEIQKVPKGKKGLVIMKKRWGHRGFDVPE